MSRNGDSFTPPASIVRAQVIPTWQPAFLAELEQTGNLAAACRAACTRLEVINAHRRRHQDFADCVLELLRKRKLDRDPEDRLVEIHGQSVAWDEPWAEDEEYTTEQAFLMILGRTLNASEACRRVGVSYETYRRRRDREPEFARLAALATNRACDELEGALYSRAILESDAAAVAMLRAHRPDVYRTDARSGEDNKGVTLEEAMRRGFERRKELPS